MKKRGNGENKALGRKDSECQGPEAVLAHMLAVQESSGSCLARAG